MVTAAFLFKMYQIAVFCNVILLCSVPEVNHKHEKYSFEKERINREKDLHLWLWRASA